MGPSVDPGPFIAQAKGKSTKDMSFMTGSNLRTTIEFTGALKLRYSLAYATLSDFDSEIKRQTIQVQLITNFMPLQLLAEIRLKAVH